MGINPAWRGKADHLLQPSRIAAKQTFWDDASLDDLLLVIQIIEEGVERCYPLLNPARQTPPFACINNARDHIKGNEAFLGLFRAIDVEGNSCPPKTAFCIAMLAGQIACLALRKP